MGYDASRGVVAMGHSLLCAAVVLRRRATPLGVDVPEGSTLVLRAAKHETKTGILPVYTLVGGATSCVASVAIDSTPPGEHPHFVSLCAQDADGRESSWSDPLSPAGRRGRRAEEPRRDEAAFHRRLRLHERLHTRLGRPRAVFAKEQRRHPGRRAAAAHPDGRLRGAATDWQTLAAYTSTYTATNAPPDLAVTQQEISEAVNFRAPRGATVETRVYCRKANDSGREAPLGFRDFRVRVCGKGPSLLFIVR